jgi:hypothetical protein
LIAHLPGLLMQAAAGGPAPQGGTARSASAKVPPATWPRHAQGRSPKGASNAAGLAGIVEDNRLPPWSAWPGRR